MRTVSLDKTLRNALIGAIIVILSYYAVQTSVMFTAIKEGMELVARAEPTTYQRYNNKAIGDTSRRIGSIIGVERAAVIVNKGHMLVGVRVEDAYEYDKPSIHSSVSYICKALLSGYDDEKIAVTVDDELSEKVIELSEFIDKDLEKSTLTDRFNFLYSEIQKQ